MSSTSWAPPMRHLWDGKTGDVERDCRRCGLHARRRFQPGRRTPTTEWRLPDGTLSHRRVKVPECLPVRCRHCGRAIRADVTPEAGKLLPVPWTHVAGDNPRCGDGPEVAYPPGRDNPFFINYWHDCLCPDGGDQVPYCPRHGLPDMVFEELGAVVDCGCRNNDGCCEETLAMHREEAATGYVQRRRERWRKDDPVWFTGSVDALDAAEARS